MKAINLKTEYLINPIGIDIQNPRLMWTCSGGKTQSAYRIVAVTDGETVWDSGKVLSAEMHADYQPKLVSRQRVEWTVTVWNEHDEEGEKADAFFEMGLLSSSDFKAKWICGNYGVNKKKRYPVDCFRKTFNAFLCPKSKIIHNGLRLIRGKTQW